MEKQFYVYILSSERNGTLYIGVTSDLIQRIWQHKNNEVDGFTSRFNVHQLVYYEECPDAESAILREKQLKKWNRTWKIRLIEKFNLEWNDLYQNIIG